MCQVPLFQHKEAYLGEMPCRSWAVGSTVHMGMPLCVVLQLRTSCLGTLNRFTEAGGCCSQHWRGHLLLLCGSVRN